MVGQDHNVYLWNLFCSRNHPPAHLKPKVQKRTSSVWHREKIEVNGYSAAQGKQKATQQCSEQTESNK